MSLVKNSECAVCTMVKISVNIGTMWQSIKLLFMLSEDWLMPILWGKCEDFSRTRKYSLFFFNKCTLGLSSCLVYTNTHRGKSGSNLCFYHAPLGLLRLLCVVYNNRERWKIAFILESDTNVDNTNVPHHISLSLWRCREKLSADVNVPSMSLMSYLPHTLTVEVPVYDDEM